MWTSPASVLTLEIASADCYCLTGTLCCPVTGSTQTLLISHANCSWTSTLYIYGSDSQGQTKLMVYCVIPWEVQHRPTPCPPPSIPSGWDVKDLHSMPRATPTPCLLPIFPFFQIQLAPAMFKCCTCSVIEWLIEMMWVDASGNDNNAFKHQISKVNIVIILRILTRVSKHLNLNPCSEEQEAGKFRYSLTLELFQTQRVWSLPFLHCSFAWVLQDGELWNYNQNQNLIGQFKKYLWVLVTLDDWLYVVSISVFLKTQVIIYK